MLTHDTAGEVREADYPQEWQSSLGEGLTFPISYHFEPGAAEDGLTIDVPVATLNRVAADDFSWNVPGLREELVTEPDPQPAQEPAGQLRAGARTRPASSWPRCRRGRSRCSTRSSATSAPPPASSCRARRGTGPRCPSTCARPTGSSTTAGASRRAARTSRRSRSRCGPTLRRGDGRGRRRQRASRRPARRPGPSAPSRRPSPRGAPATRCAATPASSTRARRSGCAVFGSADEQEARHRLGVRRLLLLDDAVAGQGGARLARQRREAGPGRVAVPLGRRAARGLPGRRRQAVVDARPAGARRGGVRGAAPRRRAGPGGARCARCSRDVVRALEGWRRAEKLLSGRAEMVTAAGADRHARPARAAGRPRLRGEAGAAALRRYPAYLAAIDAAPRAARRRRPPSTATGS